MTKTDHTTIDSRIDAILDGVEQYYTMKYRMEGKPLSLGEAKAELWKIIGEAQDEYPWEKIAQHATYSIPIINLDADPSGGTTEYQECYMLPKKWVDEQRERLQQLRNDGRTKDGGV